MKDEGILKAHILKTIIDSDMYNMSNNLISVFRKFGYRRTKRNKLETIKETYENSRR